jgi:subtilisin family serine protease
MIRAVLIALLALTLLPPLASADGLAPPTWVEGQVVVRLAPGVSIGTINARYGTSVIEQMPGQPQTYLLATAPGRTTRQTLRAMRGDPDLDWSDANQYGGAPEAIGGQSNIGAYDGTPTPEEYDDQWAARQINADAAHAVATGRGVIVAVLDTGVDRTHPKLAGRLLRGYDFLDGDADPGESCSVTPSPGGGCPDGPAVGHGTHVAGLVLLAAPEATILPVRVLDRNGVGPAWAVAKGIRYAASQGARVINLSLSVYKQSKAIYDAIRDVRGSGGRGAMTVASVGNAGLDLSTDPRYPALDSHALGIAATDPADLKAGFSNFGSPVDLSAPGEAVYSTFVNGGWATWSGTSMAAPLVAGAAALVWERFPNCDSGKIVQFFQEPGAASVSIDDENPQYRGKLGAGRLDLLRAVRNEPNC